MDETDKKFMALSSATDNNSIFSGTAMGAKFGSLEIDGASTLKGSVTIGGTGDDQTLDITSHDLVNGGLKSIVKLYRSSELLSISSHP